MAKTVYVKNLHPVDFNPFAQHVYKCVAPSIEPQREIFVSCLIGEHEANLAYNESVSLQFTGKLNLDAIKKALTDVVDRHEALRASFNADGSKICISENASLNLEYTDLSRLNSDDQQAQLSQFLLKDSSTPFDLLNGPLFRTTLFKQADEQHLLVLTAHHIISDGWSFGIIIEDLAKLYSKHVKNDSSALDKAFRFCEYAIQQKEFLKTEEYALTEAYWLDLYKDGGFVFDIPTDYARPAIKSYSSQREDFPLDPSLVSSFKKFGAKANCSLVVSLLAAYEVLLHHISGQDQLIVGMPSAGQSINDKYGLVGHCVNFLPLRTVVDNKLSFTDYLKKRRTEVLNAFEHQQFTLGSLLKKVRVDRDPSRVTLTPVVFNVDMGMDKGVVFEGLHHKLIHNKRQSEHFEIFLNISGLGDDLTMQWSYNTALFAKETVENWDKNFNQILRKVIDNPEIKIQDLFPGNNYMPAQDGTVSNTSSNASSALILPELISKAAKLYANKIAVKSHGQYITYEELEIKSNQLANLLTAEGLSIGCSVGLLCDRSVDMIVSMIAIIKTGAVYIPLDPDFPVERLEFMLKDSAAKFLFASRAWKNKFKSGAKEIILEDSLLRLDHYPGEFDFVEVTRDNTVYILYTSGSTGKPKGVQITHCNLSNLLISMQKDPGLKESDVFLALTTISFDIAQVELFLPLISGATVFLLGHRENKDASLILRVLKEEKITVMQATPTTWEMLLMEGWIEKLPMKAFSGGEALPKTLAKKLLENCQEVYNLYGPTETTVYSTCKKIITENNISIGRPIQNTQVYILDDRQQAITNGSVGEIAIGGSGVAVGYLNRPELTGQKFISRPEIANGSKIYLTGDLGKIMPNGEIQCLGRKDQQVKIRGFRIELEEIEHCLLQCKWIERAVVVVSEDPLGSTLTAFIIPSVRNKEEQSSLLNGLKSFLKGKLPYYMLPKDYVFLDSLPLTPNGKIDRKVLADISVNKPKSQTNNLTVTNAQGVIQKIWQEILHKDSIGIHEDFFDLGGHSLTAVQMLSRLKKETGIYLPISIFFSSSTIAKMSLLVSKRDDETVWNCLVPIQPNGSRPPLYLVHGASGSVPFFNRQVKALHRDQPVFGLQASGLNGKGELHKSIEEMASFYISEILQQNSSGPYLLGGYSLGGFIAFEMAKQLKALGKDVKMLAIFDTQALPGSPKGSAAKFWGAAKNQFCQSFYAVKLFFKDPISQYEYQRSLVKAYFRKPYYTWKKLFGKEKNYFYYKYLVSKNSIRALKNFNLSSYDGTIDLFKAKKKTYYMKDFELLGWSSYANQIRVHEIPGDHNKIFMPPYDEEFAEVLQRCIDEALSRGARISAKSPRHLLRAI